MLGRACQRSVARIADGDQHIPHKARAADAFDRTFGEQNAESGIVEPGQFGKLRRVQCGARGKLRFTPGLREFVPRANRQAIVAAIDAVAEQRTQFARDRSLVLDSEIRDAAPRIETIRCGKRVSWTDVEAGAATAAMVVFGGVRRQIERGEERAQKQPRAVVT